MEGAQRAEAALDVDDMNEKLGQLKDLNLQLAGTKDNLDQYKTVRMPASNLKGAASIHRPENEDSCCDPGPEKIAYQLRIFSPNCIVAGVGPSANRSGQANNGGRQDARGRIVHNFAVLRRPHASKRGTGGHRIIRVQLSA